MKNLTLTKITVNGARDEPILPAHKHVFMMVVRIFVGHNSAVSTKVDVYAHVIDALPNKNSSKAIVLYSFGKNGEIITESAAKLNIIGIIVRRFIRFNKICDRMIPGISMPIVKMKLT